MNVQNMFVYDILRGLAPQSSAYLGIGVQEGGCVDAVVRGNPRINLTLCDTWGPHHGGTNRGSHAHIDALLARLGFEGTVRYLDGLSQEQIPAIQDSFDLIFVDGDHLEEPAYADLVNCWPRCTGVMVVHDSHMPPVERALRRFIAEYEATYDVSNDGTGTWVIRR